MDECKPLDDGVSVLSPDEYIQMRVMKDCGRDLLSSTVRLNVSGFRGIGGAFRGYLEGIWGVSRGIRRYLGFHLSQKRLRLSCRVDECKSLDCDDHRRKADNCQSVLGMISVGNYVLGRGSHSSTSQLNLRRFWSLKPQQESTSQLRRPETSLPMQPLNIAHKNCPRHAEKWTL